MNGISLTSSHNDIIVHRLSIHYTSLCDVVDDIIHCILISLFYKSIVSTYMFQNCQYIHVSKWLNFEPFQVKCCIKIASTLRGETGQMQNSIIYWTNQNWLQQIDIRHMINRYKSQVDLIFAQISSIMTLKIGSGFKCVRFV